jgi:uncharacterized damage-inducible protein DinB
LTQAEFTRELRSSYPSVRDTFTHIVWAEWIWLQRWHGASPRLIFAPADFPDVDTLKRRWLALAADQRTFVEVLTSERLRAVVTYVNVQGQTWHYPLWRQMFHVVNHSTYHRGQLTMMLRQLNAVPVTTDFLDFADEHESGPGPQL